VIEGVRTGKFDLESSREDAIDESLTAVACGTLNYVLVVPRRFLLGKSAAGLNPAEKLPIAALAGEGQFAHSSLNCSSGTASSLWCAYVHRALA